MHRAEEEHALAQAGMMKQGLQPTNKHDQAADKAAKRTLTLTLTLTPNP